MYIQKASSVVDGFVSIDWEKAPHDAQFYSPETDINFESFVKVTSAGTVYFSSDREGFDVWVADMLLTAEDVKNDTDLIAKGE